MQHSHNPLYLIKMAEDHERRGYQKLLRARKFPDDTISDELNRSCRATTQAAEHFAIATGLRGMAAAVQNNKQRPPAPSPLQYDDDCVQTFQER
jgi:hypothetical protein